MNHTVNRMEAHWTQLAPLIRQEWDLISQADLDDIDQEFDRLVDIIHQRYGGRTEIIQEAAIRTRVNQMLANLEQN